MQRLISMAAAVAISLLAVTPPAAASLGEADEFNAIEIRVIEPREIPETSQADTEYNLAVKYYNEGYKAFATGWFRKAVEDGEVQGQSYLGLAYETGLGVRKNYKEALKWYKLAAARNERDARCGLGRLYAHGLGVRRDDAAAAKWFRLAADQGLPEAQYALGLFYRAGRGVGQDDGEAYFWLALASKTLDSAMKTRDTVAKRLTDPQLQAIHLRLLQWKPAD